MPTQNTHRGFEALNKKQVVEWTIGKVKKNESLAIQDMKTIKSLDFPIAYLAAFEAKGSISGTKG